MTVQKLHDYFYLLLDKFGSPYFTDDEIDLFLNSAQTSIINSYFPDNEKYKYNIEFNQHLAKCLGKLYRTTNISAIFPIDVILYEDIDAQREISRLLSIKDEDNNSIDYLRHNDEAKAIQNYFLEPDIDNPSFKFIQDGIEVIPQLNKNVIITYLVEPLDISLDSGQTSELASFLHYDVVSEAINKAGVATRDEAMTQLNQI